MKRFYLFMGFVACMAVIVSCEPSNGELAQDDEMSVGIPNASWPVVFIHQPDGIQSELQLAAAMWDVEYLLPSDTEKLSSLLPEAFLVPNMERMEISFEINNTHSFGVSLSLQDEVQKYNDELRKPIIDEMYRVQAQTGKYMKTCNLLCAGVRDGARIYADKTLFGREPGENLGDMFYYWNICDSLILSYPSFEVVRNLTVDNSPVTFDEFFAPGNVLPGYCSKIRLKELPTENVDEITFNIEIPFECTYWQDKFYGYGYDSFYIEHYHVEPNVDRVLKGSVTIRFEE